MKLSKIHQTLMDLLDEAFLLYDRGYDFYFIIRNRIFEPQAAKLHMILKYFHTIEEKGLPTGSITFRRIVSLILGYTNKISWSIWHQCSTQTGGGNISFIYCVQNLPSPKQARPKVCWLSSGVPFCGHDLPGGLVVLIKLFYLCGQKLCF